MNYTNYIGHKVIIRANRAGVFYGTLTQKDGDEVELTDCRRLWYWDGAASISEIALSGVCKPNDCKFSVSVASIVICGVIEILPCTMGRDEFIRAHGLNMDADYTVQYFLDITASSYGGGIIKQLKESYK